MLNSKIHSAIDALIEVIGVPHPANDSKLSEASSLSSGINIALGYKQTLALWESFRTDDQLIRLTQKADGKRIEPLSGEVIFLITCAYQWMMLEDRRETVAFRDSLVRVIVELKKALSGKPAVLPGVYLLEGVGTYSEKSFECKTGALKRCPDDFTKVVGSDGAPLKWHREEGLHVAGVNYIIQLQLEVVESSDGQPPRFRTRFENMDGWFLTYLTSAFGLGQHGDKIGSGRFRSKIVLRPFMCADVSHRPFTQYRPFGLKLLSDNELRAIGEWIDRLRSLDTSGINIALDRFATALNERALPADRIIDCFVGMENLFWARGYNKDFIAKCIGKLFPDGEYPDKKDIQDRAKELYQKRSNIVHSNAEMPSQEELEEVARQSLMLFKETLMVLITHYPELLPLTSEDRAARIQRIAH